MHYGVADDLGPEENHIYGKKTINSEHVNDVFFHYLSSFR